jgi:hypothetical protein
MPAFPIARPTFGQLTRDPRDDLNATVIRAPPPRTTTSTRLSSTHHRSYSSPGDTRIGVALVALIAGALAVLAASCADGSDCGDRGPDGDYAFSQATLRDWLSSCARCPSGPPGA